MTYDRVTSFARKWKVDQTGRVNSASKRTPSHESDINYLQLDSHPYHEVVYCYRLMKATTNTFVIGNFPQLRLIAWNRNPHDAITGEEAFDLYEKNWRFVDENALTPHERALIERLIREYGNGILHV